jgi:dihydroorotate dehydrogenase (NAD+) catalytic subunit
MDESSEITVDLSVDLGKLKLSSPVLAASGTFGYGLEYLPFVDLNSLAGFSTKGLSLKPRIGNPVPRVIDTEAGMLNAIGLENVGLDAFLKEKIPLLKQYSARIIVNFFGESEEEYVEMAQALSEVECIDALEMNISCPNVATGGHQFSSSPQRVESVVSKTRNATHKFLIVKLSPNVQDIGEIAKAAESAGADALSVANTYVGMKIDIRTGKPYIANRTGGLSGSAIKPLSLYLVNQTAKAVKIPIFGIGGIASAEDVLEYLYAGAKAVQIGTANFMNPAITQEVVDDLEKLCRELGIKKLSGIRPCL